MTALQGDLNAEKQQFIEQERERYLTIHNRADELSARYEEGALDAVTFAALMNAMQRDLRQESAFSDISNLHDYLSNRREKGEEAVFVDGRAYEMALSIQPIGRMQTELNWIFTILALIVTIASYATDENKTGIKQLIQTTKKRGTSERPCEDLILCQLLHNQLFCRQHTVVALSASSLPIFWRQRRGAKQSFFCSRLRGSFVAPYVLVAVGDHDVTWLLIWPLRAGDR